jgi:hypothetical protein
MIITVSQSVELFQRQWPFTSVWGASSFPAFPLFDSRINVSLLPRPFPSCSCAFSLIIYTTGSSSAALFIASLVQSWGSFFGAGTGQALLPCHYDGITISFWASFLSQ